MRRFLDLPSGVGLVVANMIGAGVLISAGFMAQALRPATILAAWAVGGGLALAGSVAYGALATRVPRNGGEYRFVSDLVHPALGFLAGWASLLVGFAAPIAIDGIAAGSFLATIWPGAPSPAVTGTVLIVALTLVHAGGLELSRGAQNALVAVKLAGIVAFVVVGLVLGPWALPDWAPPDAPAGPTGWVRPFLENQLWIAFAFSGWNAAVYATAEFRDPARTVPRAMLLGTLGVAVLYLLVNAVLLANLDPGELSLVLSSDLGRITLGHVVAEKLLGPVGGGLMSAFVVVAMVSAMSAMTLVGPRVYAAMAEDGVLPSVLAARDGRPPVGSVVLQGAIALFLLHTQAVLELVKGVGAVLVLFSALSIVGLLRLGQNTPATRLAAGVYLVGAALILVLADAWPWILGVGAVGLVAWGLRRRRSA